MTDPAKTAAQKITAAFNDRFERCVSYEDDLVALCLAVALRAAADEVVPEIDEPEWGACTNMHCDIELYTAHLRTRRQFLAIAAELEGQP
jgi:hypothetical protein